jgi:CheY-like chemotaxis protein
MKKIIIVDDDQWLVDIFSLILKKSGWKVRVCHDGYQAIEMLDSEKPDVILLDFFLPHATGAALLNELSTHSDLRDIPVVLCSTAALPLYSSQQQIGAVLDKSTLTPESLMATLEKVLA